MTRRGFRARRLVFVTGLAAALAVSGCSGTDVELQGGVFNALGVAGVIGGKKKEAKAKNRTGLVMPPSTKRLPKPGSGADPEAPRSAAAWPVDPEEKKAEHTAALRKKHKQYCEKALLQAKAEGDDDGVQGPMGPCEKSVLDMFKSGQSQ